MALPDVAAPAPPREELVMAPTGRILAWSNSALSMLQDCGEKFRRRYLEREWVAPSPRQIRGTAVHRVARTALLRKLRDEVVPTVEEARDLAADEFDRAWAGGATLSEDDLAEGIDAVAGRAKDFAVDLAGFHTETLVPTITPIGVERQIIIKPRDADLQINGTVDLIGRIPEGEEIRDLKTSEKSPNGEAAERSQQLTLYALIRYAEVKALPHRLRLDYLIRTPKKAETKHVPLDTTRSVADVQSLVARINTAVEAVKRGTFVPANPDWWGCSATYCDYFRTCPYVRRGTNRPAH